ncbi:hypothetical protein PHYBLDRAFT_173310 [Phycomyces blakesleeanus NRRL 1555(-)]|uniref:Uncharacterized protein n=1 Tax=Phycomyces blakesleeanus (strain ATCC 8743b / DSM 1359 / FGSC 10004 / NBRC 33097 / NRRL 1555) TaxID=763407 RepID=A0A162ND25_PHYB8|nr:hypothetical protein PHYBLDRAFT_173310 [Phycomyces blakesleeanus NRRL 1555(-)]OAD68304.1 hypothetical protein PHYBLDRAFT_173310 [Phycomyces blakesleeanus NRRL 1555(-)]|eukprot:XP_018286344.1 hypothetical protein PHYBLDRAFT_173310 [Phycomyces blakesleeanus NRRL 1555(-)]
MKETHSLSHSDAPSSQQSSGLARMNIPLTNVPFLKNFHPCYRHCHVKEIIIPCFTVNVLFLCPFVLSTSNSTALTPKKRALGLPTKLAPYRSDTVYPAHNEYIKSATKPYLWNPPSTYTVVFYRLPIYTCQYFSTFFHWTEVSELTPVNKSSSYKQSFASIQLYHQSIQNIASTIASIVKHNTSILLNTASIVKNKFPIVPAILSSIFTFSLPIAAISRSSPNMSQLLSANCMQSLPAELVTFLTSMQSQFNALNEPNVWQENADLQSQLLQNNGTGPVSSSASLPAPQSTADLGTAASTWATKTSLILLAKTPRVSSACWVAASQRLFSDKTGSDGFEYVHIPRSRRITHSEMHRSLRTLSVDTGHLLDINFPACGVIGVLVYVQYLEEFKSQLASAKVSLVNNFDPLDLKNVADPKFVNLSVSGLETQALVLQNVYCLQALKFLRSHLVLPVAHFFVQSGWIGLEEILAYPVAEHFGDDPNKKRALDALTAMIE